MTVWWSMEKEGKSRSTRTAPSSDSTQEPGEMSGSWTLVEVWSSTHQWILSTLWHNTWKIFISIAQMFATLLHFARNLKTNYRNPEKMKICACFCGKEPMRLSYYWTFNHSHFSTFMGKKNIKTFGSFFCRCAFKGYLLKKICLLFCT